MMYEVNAEGKTRLSRDPMAQMRAALKTTLQIKGDISPIYWARKFLKAKTILDWFFMPSTPQKAAKIIDESLEKYYTMADRNSDWKKEPRELSVTSFRLNFPYLVKCLTAISGRPLPRIRHIYLRVTADNRGSRILIALRRFKNKTSQWPRALDDIKSIAPAETFVDPINGSSFVYKLSEENFTFYSKGKNNIDEGGKRDRWGKEKTGANDWLIWPPKTRKTKEENADAEQQ